MFVRSSIPGNAAAAKSRDLSHADMHYVMPRIGRQMTRVPIPAATRRLHSTEFQLLLARKPVGMSALCRMDRAVDMLERAMTQFPHVRIIFFLVDICVRLL